MAFVYEENPPPFIGELSRPKKKDAPFRDTADVVPIFKTDGIDERLLSAPATAGTAISLNDKTNRSLKLAERADFLEMCRPSLLGTEDEREFGELLRGLVLSFVPDNEYHLHILAQIADVQWQLRRAVRYRQGIFNANSDQRNTSGMNLGTEKAFDNNHITRKLTEEHHRLVDLYDKVRGRK